MTQPALMNRGQRSFAPTRWSLVLAAGEAEAGEKSRKALGELAQVYWFPLYAYVRRQGCSAEQAEDLTQEFFARLLDKHYLGAVDRSKGKFRCYLLACLKHFLSNEWDRLKAKKRGGGRRIVAMDAGDAESRYALEPVDHLTPERLYERRWALAVVEEVLNRLRESYLKDGKAELFDGIKQALAGDCAAATYEELGRKVGMSEGAVKVAAHRLRQRYREMLREEIGQTVEGEELVEEEIGYLLNCL